MHCAAPVGARAMRGKSTALLSDWSLKAQPTLAKTKIISIRPLRTGASTRSFVVREEAVQVGRLHVAPRRHRHGQHNRQRQRNHQRPQQQPRAHPEQPRVREQLRRVREHRLSPAGVEGLHCKRTTAASTPAQDQQAPVQREVERL